MPRCWLFFVHGWCCLAASQRAAFEASLTEPYKGYCAEPPDAQRASIAEPISENELARHNLEFTGMQLLMRHAARAPFLDQQCFQPVVHENFTACHIEQTIGYTWPGGPSNGAVPLRLRVHDGYPSVSGVPGGTEPFAAGCNQGQLMDIAVPQLQALAATLRERYFHRLPHVPALRDLWLYSTSLPRTLGTLEILLHHLFPDVDESTRPTIETRPFTGDPWSLNAWCPRLAYPTFGVHARTVQERFPELARRWQAVAGTSFNMNRVDCLLVALCSKQAPLRLPDGLQPFSDLFNETLRVVLQSYQEDGFHGPTTAASVAPVLADIAKLLARQRDRQGPALAVWSTHDATLIAILVALGVWDGQWPPYATPLVLEIYNATLARPAATYIRFVYNGRVLDLPHCHSDVGLPHGLCPIDQFLPTWAKRLREPSAWRAHCDEIVGSHPTNANEAMVTAEAEPRSLSEFSFTNMMLAVFFALCVGLLLGVGLARNIGQSREFVQTSHTGFQRLKGCEL